MHKPILGFQKLCPQYVDGWLEYADSTSGLIPRNIEADADIWNAKDAAADNYPFMVLTSYFTSRELFEGRMHDMLQMEKEAVLQGEYTAGYLFLFQKRLRKPGS